MIVAVDFDGTLAVTDYPEIISPITETINFCKKRKSKGDTLILHTCREGKPLEDAVKWCEKQGVTFDYVNENTKEKIAEYGDSRKIYADVYVDDHNILVCQL